MHPNYELGFDCHKVVKRQLLPACISTAGRKPALGAHLLKVYSVSQAPSNSTIFSILSFTDATSLLMVDCLILAHSSFTTSLQPRMVLALRR